MYNLRQRSTHVNYVANRTYRKRNHGTINTSEYPAVQLLKEYKTMTESKKHVVDHCQSADGIHVDHRSGCSADGIHADVLSAMLAIGVQHCIVQERLAFNYAPPPPIFDDLLIDTMVNK